MLDRLGEVDPWLAGWKSIDEVYERHAVEAIGGSRLPE